MRRLPTAVLAAALLAASGCGSGESVDAADGRPVTIAMSEFRLAPQELKLPEGASTLTIRNDGSMVHRFELRSEDGTRRFAIGAPLRPGRSERLRVDPRRGDYTMRCAQERHNTLGEYGTVTVG